MAKENANEILVQRAKEAAEMVAHTAAITAEALVSFTSENTKLALNIEYIQRDLAELKQDFKDSKLKYITNEEHKTLCDSNSDHETRIRLLEQQATQTRTWGLALIAAVGIVEFILIKFVK